MALKEDLRHDVKNFGKAFTAFGKGFLRSTKQITGAVKNRVSDEAAPVPDDNVFKDGTWRETAREFGKAFTGVGRSVASAVTGKPLTAAQAAEEADTEMKAAVQENAALIDSALAEQAEELRKQDSDDPSVIPE